MNAIFLPPSLEEIAEQERINKEMEEKLNKVIEEGIEELLKPLEEPLKEAFNTVKIFGKRFRMKEKIVMNVLSLILNIKIVEYVG